MALTKSILVPGWNYTATYLRVDRLDYLDELCRDCQFQFRLYVDEATAKQPGCQGHVIASVRVLTDAFDHYFSKKALAASEDDAYARIYRVIKDWQAAKVAADAYTADQVKPVEERTVPDLSPLQQAILRCVRFSNSFSGIDPFAGATDA